MTGRNSKIDLFHQSGQAFGYPGLEKWKEGVSSDVGKPDIVPSPYGPIPAFRMRAQRKIPAPVWAFGRMNLKGSASYFHGDRHSVPALNTTLDIAAKANIKQQELMESMLVIRADSLFLLRVDECLGATHTLWITAKDTDPKGVGKGVRWTPTKCPAIAVWLPWEFMAAGSSPTTRESGQVGHKIVVKTIVSNIGEQVIVPVNMYVESLIQNVDCFGWNPGPWVAPKALLEGLWNTPHDPPKPALLAEGLEEELDEVLVIAQADVNDVPAMDDGAESSPVVAEDAPSAAAEVPSEPEALAPEPVATPAGTSKPASAELNTRWIDWKNYTVKPEDMNKWIDFLVDPKILGGKKGDAVSRAYRRHVWCTGSSEMGFMTGMRIRVTSTVPPQVRGCFRIIPAKTQAVPMVFHELGGTPTEFNLLFDDVDSMVPRLRKTPWMRTVRGNQTFRMNLFSFNRTSEQKEVSVRIMYQPGNVVFNVPIKPAKAPPKYLEDEESRLLRDIMTGRVTRGGMIVLARALRQMYDIVPQGMDDSTIAPAPAEDEGVEMLAEGGAVDEELAQGEFWVNIADLLLKANETVAVPLEMPVVTDLFGSNLNPITELFERWARIIPSIANGFGPVVGEYKIVARVPAHVSGRLAHIALPGDMNLEAAERLFGLESILSIGGSAVSSIGGALVGGAIETISETVEGAVGGVVNAAGEAVSGAISSVGGLVGGALGALGGALGLRSGELRGDIPISRSFNAVDYGSLQRELEPAFGNLLLHLDQVQDSSDATTYPVSILARLVDVLCARSLVDRDVIPEDFRAKKPSLRLNIEDATHLVERLLLARSDKSLNDRRAQAILYHLMNNGGKVLSETTIDVYECLEESKFPTPEEFVSAARRL